MLSRTVPMIVRGRLHGIGTRFVWGSSLMTNEVGSGLESIQLALDSVRQGASASK